MPAAMLLLGMSSIHATEQQGDTLSLSSFAIQMLNESMPKNINYAIQKRNIITQTKASNEETRIDSIVYVRAGDPVAKVFYTFYDNGEVESIKNYMWDAEQKHYYPYSFEYHGIGGEKPQYLIIGKYDKEGKEMPEFRYDYDWTQYKEIANTVDNTKWDNVVKVQSYTNGQWETTRIVTPVIKDSKLLSLVCQEEDDQGNLAESYRITYQYDDNGNLVNVANDTHKEEGIVEYNIKYDKEGNIDWFGYADGSWYREYFHGDNFDYYTDYEVVDGKEQCQFESGVYADISDPRFNMFENQVWQLTGDNFYNNGQFSYSEMYLISQTDNNLYIVAYNEDSNYNINNVTGMRIGTSNNEIETEYYKYTDDNKWVSNGIYTLKTEELDEYTTKDTFYDELGLPSYTQTTYRHNPNSTGIKHVHKDTSLKDGKMYDLSGRRVTTKSGLRIINGKKIIFK